MYYDFHKILAEGTVEPRLWLGDGAGRTKGAKTTSAQFKGGAAADLDANPTATC